MRVWRFGARLCEQPFFLFGEMPRHFFVDIIEQGVEVGRTDVIDGSQRIGNRLVVRFAGFFFGGFVVDAFEFEIAAQPVERVALFPLFGFFGIAID